jgi:hypothetical protein
MILRPFQKVQTHPHMTNGSGVMISASWGAAENSCFLDRSAIWMNLNFTPIFMGKLEEP